MSAGLSAAISRLEAVVEGCASPVWVRSANPILGTQFLEQLTNPNGQPLDKRYWIEHMGRSVSMPVCGSLVDSTHSIRIDLVRQWAGAWEKTDHVARIQTMESQALVVEHSLLDPRNWNYTTTGIVLVNLTGEGKGPILVLPSLVRSIDLTVTLRVAASGVIV